MCCMGVPVRESKISANPFAAAMDFVGRRNSVFGPNCLWSQELLSPSFIEKVKEEGFGVSCQLMGFFFFSSPPTAFPNFLKYDRH